MLALRVQPKPASPADPAHRASTAVIVTAKWGAFLAGMALLIAVALIPPATDLDRIRGQRDRILAMEQTDLARIHNYQALVTALDERDPDTVRLILAAQLQLVPHDRTALIVPGLPEDPRLFEILEPDPIVPPAAADAPASTLARLAGDDRGRLILLSIAGLALLYGLMPPLSEPG